MTDGADVDADVIAPELPDPPSGERGHVHVLGTAHVSHSSVEAVERTIAEREPAVVAVELDEGRYHQLKGGTPADIEPRDLLRGNTVFQFLAYWMLSYVQTRLGERFDIEPGADMRAAIESAEERGIGIALVDRDIQVTIQRFWRRMSLLEKLRLIGGLFLGLFGFVDEEDDFDIEQMTDVDVVTALMEEFRRFSPGGAQALIDERDAYIAHKLIELRDAGYDVVAVVGAGHKAGIDRYLDHPETLPPMASITGTASGRRFSIVRVGMYLLTLGFLVFFGLLVMAGIDNTYLLRLFAAWFLFNGVFAFTFGKLAGARWTSAAVGGSVAWLTSLNPLLAPGWFAGYVELRHRPVNVGDISTLNEILDDEKSPLRVVMARMYAVPLFRLIMIVAMTNVGSIVASLLFPVVILSWFAPEIGGVSGLMDELVAGAENSAEILWRLVT